MIELSKKQEEKAARLHGEAIVVDTHCDTLMKFIKQPYGMPPPRNSPLLVSRGWSALCRLLGRSAPRTQPGHEINGHQRDGRDRGEGRPYQQDSVSPCHLCLLYLKPSSASPYSWTGGSPKRAR